MNEHQRVGRYEVLTRLTKGGMAELSLASTAGPGGFRKFVVLKRILPEAAGDENFVKMFLDEARVTGAFSHPAICQVFELGNDKESGLFVAMEFIAGQDLNQVVAACARQQAVLPVGYSASVVHDCALALHYAHTFKLPNGEDQTVIHRDVAQKNIMVTYDGQVKLLDFGIAKAKGALARTRAGTVKGTAGYMSPEQVRGEQIDPRSDVFGLGVVLWEMVTGRRLFSAETELLELKMILSEPIVPPHEVEPSVPRELSDVAMKALERDLAHRYKSAREMARALSQTCGHLLFDAEERAHFMKERFSEKIEAAQRLFDVAGSKDDDEVQHAVEDFRRSSQHEQKNEPEPSAPKRPAVSANKLKPAKGPGQLSAKSLKKVKAQRYGRGDESTDFEGKPLGARQAQREEQKAMTEAMVPTYEPASSSKLWPILAVVVALVVGAVVWKVMQTPSEQPQRPIVGELPGTDLPGTDLPGTDLPGTDSPQVNNPPKNPDQPKDNSGSKDPVVRNNPPRQQGEVTLALIPEATVSKGSTRLGQGTFVTFSLPVGTHLVTIKGEDGVKRKLSLQVGAGKNKPQRYRLDDLPPE
ncbi:MAG: serine/threonine protein kinase [Archangium sp.]|nr:serine/threonine protein kinase [Archangium sp.]